MVNDRGLIVADADEVLQVNDENRSHAIVGVALAELITEYIEHIVWIGSLFLELKTLRRFLRLLAHS